MRLIDLTGQRFGKLIALSYDKKEQKWLCQCDCGNKKLIKSGNLRGSTNSCGCIKYKDLTGQRFGRLTAVKRIGRKEGRDFIWECLCDCSNTINAITRDLTRGAISSCGCLADDWAHEGLRERYDAKRVDGVTMHLFTDKPRKTNKSGYRGVRQYRTRVTNELRYQACITVKGKKYCKSGFLTPEDAYYQGRLMLEEEHLPKRRKRK